MRLQALLWSCVLAGPVGAQDTLRYYATLEPPEDSALVATRAGDLGLRVAFLTYGVMGFQTTLDSLVVALDTVGITAGEIPQWLRTRILRPDGTNAVQDARSDPRNDLALPDTPDSPLEFGKSWGLDSGRVHRAHALGVTGAEVRVAIFDTGYETNHPEFAGRIVECVSIIQGKIDSLTPGACRQVNALCKHHGSHVAGTVGGATVGVAPGALLMLVNGYLPTDSCGNFTSDRAIFYRWAHEHGAQVANVSTGSVSMFPSEVQRVTEFTATGGVVCAAAGNSGSTTVFSPARVPAAFGIGALMRWGGMQWTSYSNADSTIDFADAGDGINSVIGMGYGEKSGTSMASPHCAGKAALVKQVQPNISRDSVYALFKASAKDLSPTGFDNKTGWGFVRADRLAALALGLSLQPTSTAGTVVASRGSSGCVPVDSPVEWSVTGSVPGVTLVPASCGLSYTVAADAPPGSSSVTLTGVP